VSIVSLKYVLGKLKLEGKFMHVLRPVAVVFWSGT
jgi:hypothetical protein